MVKWAAPARKDLKEIYDYIAKDSKYYAKNVVKNIVAKTEELKNFPLIGRIVPEIGDENVRELLTYSYRLIYEIKPGVVEILALIHGKRDFSSINRTEFD
jgi:toxin ParE1/3/4